MPALKHEFHPRGGCKEVMEARDPEVLISGPAGTGKSRACLEKIHLVMLLNPGARALILRKTQRSLGSSALVTWRNYVAKEALATGEVVYYGGSSAEPPQYRYKNGSSVTIGGLDNPMRVMSTEYDIVYIQEATEVTPDDIEMVKTRLRNWVVSFQQLVMDCNPAGDKHWLKIRCNEGRTRLIESRHEDNPRLFNADGTLTERGADYIAILDNLTGVRYKRLRLGLWVTAEGVVYEEFDPAVHVVDWLEDVDGNRIVAPGWETWSRYWAIDFGFTHPFVLKCYAEGPDGELYMYREIYMTQRTVAEHAKTIMDIVTEMVPDPDAPAVYGLGGELIREQRMMRQWKEPMPTAIICDWDAQARRTFERETGLGTQQAIKHVSEGIDLHKVRLSRRRFFLLRDSLVERDQDLAMRLLPTRTEEEYPGYAWKVDGPTGRVLDEPVKVDDHGMDTDRYMTAHLDFRGKARATILE